MGINFQGGKNKIKILKVDFFDKILMNIGVIFMLKNIWNYGLV